MAESPESDAVARTESGRPREPVQLAAAFSTGTPTIAADLTVTDRRPPYSLEAEAAVLGAVLVSGDAVSRALQTVKAPMFYREANRRIYTAVETLFERGDVVDLITVTEELKRHEALERAGGIDYLASLVDAVPTAANVEYHARIIRDKALLRRLIEEANAILRDTYEQGDSSVRELLDRAESRIFEVAEDRQRDTMVRIKQSVFEAVGEIERLQESGERVTGVSTGFQDIDEMTTGLRAGDLCVVAGRPSMGKTAWALNVAAHAATRNMPVLVFSLEMSAGQLVQRLLCSEGRIDAQRLRKSQGLGSEDYRALASAADRLSRAPMWIDDKSGGTVLEIRAKTRRLQSELRAREEKLGLVVIDYMQLMSASRPSESRVQEVSRISRGIKALARELEVPVIAVSQLSRGPEQRPTKRPLLSDLRDSGSIEQDADIVLFLYRPEYYEQDPDRRVEVKGQAEVMIAKQRNGPTGSVDLYFHQEYTRFDSVASGPRDGPSEYDARRSA